MIYAKSGNSLYEKVFFKMRWVHPIQRIRYINSIRKEKRTNKDRQKIKYMLNQEIHYTRKYS